MHRSFPSLAAACCLMLAPASRANLVNQGVFSLSSIAPAGVNVYAGGGIAFVPGGTDSIAQDTLVIHWCVKDTVDTSRFNQVFQRITIPGDGGTPTVLATATIRWDFLYNGVNQYGGSSAGYAPGDLAFDPVNRKLVFNGAGTGNNVKFVAMDLFSTDATVSSIAWSKNLGDVNSGGFGRIMTVTADGRYQTFYKYDYQDTLVFRKASLALSDMNGTVSITKVDIPISEFQGWYPNADRGLSSGKPNVVDGYNCEGAVTYGPDDLLVIRNFKNSAAGERQESHLYMTGAALDVAAIDAAMDLGNTTELSTEVTNRVVYGVTADPTAGLAFLRYGYIDQPGRVSDSKIMIVGGLPIVPEPLTLALLAGGLALATRPRRHG